MKLFCDKCQKVFDVQNIAGSAGETACPHCGELKNFPDSRIAPGVVIGDFLIEAPLNKGGMGEVFVARQISLDREVALKILQDRFTGDREYIDALFREARAAAKVSHPNIVQAYAVGEEDGVFYFAMELVRGRTFKEIIKAEKKISPDKALKVIREIASALDAAWREQKLVHQDIKPDNIMLDVNGFAKLADLGLARKAGVNDEHAEAGDEVLGTPQYISPEQLTGVPTDVRSDIYSLGATFYHMVTGRYAYVADTVEEMSRKHVEGNLEPPKSVEPDIPDSVNAIIVKMMSRKRENRYQTPEELIKDIDAALKDGVKKAPPSVTLKLRKTAVQSAAPQSETLVVEKSAAVPKAVKPVALKTPEEKKRVPLMQAAKTAAASAGSVNKPVPVAAVAKKAVPEVEKTASAPVNAVPVQPTPAAVKAVPVQPAPAPVNAVPVQPKPAAVKAVPVQPTPPQEQKKTGSDTSKSVRSVLIAKHNDSSSVEAENEIIDEIISAEKKKISVGKILAIVIPVILVLLLVSAACILIFCHEKSWVPAFAKPYGEKLNALIKKRGADTNNEQTAEKAAEPQQSVAPAEKPKQPVTRPEYIEKVEKFLTMFRNDPTAKKEFLAAIRPELTYILAPVTEEERIALKPLLSIYNMLDETLVFAPYREKEARIFAEKLEKKREAARRAEIAKLEQQKKEREMREAEMRRIEADRKRVEAERQAHLENFRKEVNSVLQPVVSGAAKYFVSGNDEDYNTALENSQKHIFRRPQYAEEEKVISSYKNSVKVVMNSVDGFKKVVSKINDISKHALYVRMYVNSKWQTAQVLGISANGMVSYKLLSGKSGESHLSEQQVRRFSRAMRFVVPEKELDFYLTLMAKRPSTGLRSGTANSKVKQLWINELKSKAPNSSWKAFLGAFSGLL